MMQRRLLEILARPVDKHHPLELREFSTEGDLVAAGILLCGECGRFYPIIDEIPVMLPDDLRSRRDDLAFLTKHKDMIPKETLVSCKPVNLA